MFGWLKKEKNTPVDHTEVLEGAATIILVQLKASPKTESFDEICHSNFVRGYFVGVIDAALRNSGASQEDQGKYLALVMEGHAILMGDKKIGKFVMDSYSQQDESDFKRGLNTGWQEYLDFLKGVNPAPRKLLDFFKSSQS
ncbi:hypothetical protein [Pseudomonas guariconensis]|uniref:hypothetical protein n=1 Tax=Pseudomonas guariconensis TaxID=1288410 RepID=UPI0018D5FA84|nr:hypothetical protein [Pseudomonas guariconensis]MBH3360471.1 hypothetical protein [Pseudomonas guariconensis]